MNRHGGDEGIGGAALCVGPLSPFSLVSLLGGRWGRCCACWSLKLPVVTWVKCVRQDFKFWVGLCCLKGSASLRGRPCVDGAHRLRVPLGVCVFLGQEGLSNLTMYITKPALLALEGRIVSVTCFVHTILGMGV